MTGTKLILVRIRGLIPLILVFQSAIGLVKGKPPSAPGLVSTVSSAGQTGGAASHSPTLSENGRLVVFVSQANNLVTNDHNGDRMDVFVRDLSAGTTELISVNLAGTSGGNGNSYNPIISSNGDCHQGCREFRFIKAILTQLHLSLNRDAGVQASACFPHEIHTQPAPPPCPASILVSYLWAR